MNASQRFPNLTADTAPEPSRPLVNASQRQFGFVPSPVARAARSPALLKYLLSGFGAFDHSSLSHAEREVVAFTVAFENECHYCMALHSAALEREPRLTALREALRAGAPLVDAKLEAIRLFARGVLRDRGRVDEATWEAFTNAGYGEEHALDVVLGVGLYMLSTTTNILTQAPLDPPFEAFRWAKPTR